MLQPSWRLAVFHGAVFCGGVGVTASAFRGSLSNLLGVSRKGTPWIFSQPVSGQAQPVGGDGGVWGG